ncbi:MAG: fused MFS/spermidine synthase [Gammaproteobacteria bacterium]|nr:fused MFS/spermidine synthase [Gammaproteobacteria bacterium]
MRRLLCLTALLCLSMAATVAEARVVHEERSLYRNILVQDQGRERCLLFSERRRSGAYQTCIDREDPDRLVFSYVRMMFAGLLLAPAPERILLIGLGGGTMPRVLDALYPQAEQDLVEIDPAVVRVAKAFFDFEPTANMRIHERDGRVFVKRALLGEQKWDLILLDAFTDEYIPEHMLTQEFLEELKGLLSEGGVVVANTFANSRLYHHESATYRAAFPTVASLRESGSFNRILIGLDRPWPEQATLDARASELSPALDRFGVDIESYARSLRTEWSFDRRARVLTDRYAPANLLQGRSVLGPLQKE